MNKELKGYLTKKGYENLSNIKEITFDGLGKLVTDMYNGKKESMWKVGLIDGFFTYHIRAGSFLECGEASYLMIIPDTTKGALNMNFLKDREIFFDRDEDPNGYLTHELTEKGISFYIYAEGIRHKVDIKNKDPNQKIYQLDTLPTTNN